MTIYFENITVDLRKTECDKWQVSVACVDDERMLVSRFTIADKINGKERARRLALVWLNQEKERLEKEA